ncbi:TadE/TadG family type IV pilus assembly protein [Vibrio sonorensis]|uniref:TadE/TadG family type IV pilus assembly protein n=1 Tax=Vibrio sonorensis TaxID=1004316 RepID=UPI0008D8E982|nr:TadE family protein [Vibrio sonorensis]
MRAQKRQRGLSIVEFTIVATALLIVIFGIIEVGRYVYSLQLINDMTRSAARLAAVCRPQDRTDIPTLVVPPNAPGGFTANNIEIDYLGVNGSTIDLTSSDAFSNIRYVRARVVNFQYQFAGLLSFLNDLGLLNIPDYEAIRPRENLGFHRGTDDNPVAITDC